MNDPDPEGAKASTEPARVGQRLRAERQRRRVGLRELARRVNVSASLISQIELGRATPSVGTLYAIVNELGLSFDELFLEMGRDADGATDVPATPAPSRPTGLAFGAGNGGTAHGAPVVRAADRRSMSLGSGVTWEWMTTEPEHGVDFLWVTYDGGGASAPEHSLIRHGGREYGHLLEGRLNVSLGFETYELEPGDSISFDSTLPHRLFNPGDIPAKAIWCVVGRDDPRTAVRPEPS